MFSICFSVKLHFGSAAFEDNNCSITKEALMWPMLIKQVVMIAVAVAVERMIDDDRGVNENARQKWRV
jgi:hypothetical protein